MLYKVMLVDDEYMILKGLQQIIPWSELGFEIVATARTGQEALDYLAVHAIDLMISDITMPEMSGIEMIDQLRQQGQEFAVIFLSGYQEFKYVKEGIRLGVKDYLVKPVDQEELLAIVKKIQRELMERQDRQRQIRLYLENSLSRWLNDELNDQEFHHLAKKLNISPQGTFTVLKLIGEGVAEDQLRAFLEKERQALVITGTSQQGLQLTVIFQGEQAQLKAFLTELQRLYANSVRIYLGETITGWENVYESYGKVLQIQELNNFYPDLLPEQQIASTNFAEAEFSFFAFNKSLMIGDLKTIQRELDQIFAEAVGRQLQPEQARYITFLLFTDIARQYPTTTKVLYEETIQKIRQSQTVYQLKRLLEAVLQLINAQPVKRQFSEATQQVIEIITKRYQQDLNLKAVADELHLNAVYLGQLFKKELHKSFSQYLNQVRIKKAQQLLLYSHQNINEIADQIGYNNTNYFSKMFKKLNGITPKEFRDQYISDYSAVEQELM